MVLTFLALSAKAQFVDGTTGLLNCPSAEMNESGTFTITNNFLNKHITSNASHNGWDYHTFGYGFGITFWSRLEVNYICTIFNGDWNPHAVTYREKIIKNQDRHFAAKVLLLKEGEFGKSWIPALAIGVSDPVTSTGGEYIGSDVTTDGNGFFNRMYIVATKHFTSSWGEIGASLGYQYNLRQDPHYNAPCAAVTWRPVWLQNRWFSPKFVLEYDSLTPNIGFLADIWDSRFQAMFELQNFQWVSFGLRFKLRLKGSE